MDHEKRVEVLLAALSERYESLRAIRDRVQTIGLAVIGLLLGATGWLIQSEKHFTWAEKGAAAFILISAVAVLRFSFLADLEKGFRTQLRVAAKIEKALGFYTPGEFKSVSDTIYPEEWSHAGENDGPGRFFNSTYRLIYVGTLTLLLTLLLFVRAEPSIPSRIALTPKQLPPAQDLRLEPPLSRVGHSPASGASGKVAPRGTQLSNAAH